VYNGLANEQAFSGSNTCRKIANWCNKRAFSDHHRGSHDWIWSDAGKHILLKLRMAIVAAQVADWVRHITAECNHAALEAANGMII
jgi:hypothetical protein